MDRHYSCAVVLGVLMACVQVGGCGGGSSTSKILTVATTTLPNGTVGVPYSATLQATGGTSPYTWSQTSGGAMPGGITLSSAGVFVGTPTASGNFGPYVFTVTDSSNTTATSQSLSITIASTSLSVTPTALPDGTVGTPYSVTLAASGGDLPYTWTETSGSAMPPGMADVTSAGVIAGTPTTAGTYGPYVFTVTDAKNATASSVSMTITIAGTAAAVCAPQGNEAALASANPYAFLVKGTDSYGNPVVLAGSFTPNGSGGISSATVDFNGFTRGPSHLQVNLAGSSYALDSSAQGCLYLALSGQVVPATAAKLAQTASQFHPAVATRARKSKTPAVAITTIQSVQFSFNLSGFDGTVYHTGRIIESDNTSGTGTNASGFIHVQDPASFALSALQANYAFGVDGWTATSPGAVRTALAGTFANASGTLSAGYADLNVGGTATGELTGGYGTLTTMVDSTTGRGTGSYFLTTPTGNLTFDFAFYILNGTDVILISTDLASGSSTIPLLTGRALASNATYGAGPLNGYYLLASQGLEASGSILGNLAEIGTLNATSSGAIPTATIYANDAGTFATNQYPNSSYTVEAASGRTSFTGLTTTPPLVYLTAGATSDDGIVGFLVGTDTQASSGVIVNQTAGAPSYSVASVSGNYAASNEEDLDGLNGSFLGSFAFNGMGGYTVTSQITGSVPNVPNLGTIAVNADGSGSLDGGNFPFVTNGTLLFAIPDSGDPLLFVFTAVQ